MYIGFSIFGGDNAPASCPPSEYGWVSSTSPYLGTHPSTTVLLGIFAILSLCFAIITAFKYNSVKVLSRRIHTQSISNTFWVLYFLSDSARQGINATRYALIDSDHDSSSMRAAFFATSLVLYGVTTLALSLALNHQRRYRSSATSNGSPSSSGGGSISNGLATQQESEPLLVKYGDRLRQRFTGMEGIFIILFVLYLVFLYVQLVTTPHDLFDIIFVTAFCLQRLPIIILVFLIMLNKTAEGPSRRSKIFLFVGMVLNTVGDLPISVWSDILPGNCVIFVANWVDIVQTLYAVSFVFFLSVHAE